MTMTSRQLGPLEINHHQTRL